MHSTHITLLDLGTAIADVLAFLGPADQHKLRRTSAAMCEWFDSAAENGSLAFFVTFPPPSAAAAGPLRWRHATANPRDTRPRKEANHATPSATVTVHLRNYCLSSFNAKARGEADDAIIEKASIRLVDDFAFEHKLVVTGLFGIRSIGGGFCCDLKAVEVELRGVGSELRSVGIDWMSNCSNLRSVTFAGFIALVEVSRWWMASCSRLESITFADDMSKLEEVGDFWLYGCSSLESIKYAGDMPKLKKVGSGWMLGCSKLEHVELAGFTALEEVGDDWLSHCSRLESISFAGLTNLLMVGRNCMYRCTKLKHVDMTGFTAMDEVGYMWMHECPNLESVMLPAHLQVLRTGNTWTRQNECDSFTDNLLYLSKLESEIEYEKDLQRRYW